LHVGDVNRVRRLRIGKDVHVVPGALPVRAIRIDELPVLAAIVGAIESALRRLNQRIDAIRIRGNCNTDTAVRSFGQSMLGELLPGGSAIIGTVQTASGTTAGQS